MLNIKNILSAVTIFSIFFVVSFLIFPQHSSASTYSYIGQFGSGGTSNGQFNQPYAVTISTSTGNIYVADSANSRVEVFNSAGTFSSTINASVTDGGNPGFVPRALALSPTTGNLYIVDWFNGRVVVYNTAGTYLFQFGGGTLSHPSGIAISSTTGTVYVSDTNNNRIEIYGPTGSSQGSFGSAGTSTGQFNAPGGIALDGSGNVYVTDQNNNRIEEFNASGTYESQFGSSGSGNGQFNTPLYIAISTTTGNIFVSDQSNNRVQIFNSSGTYQSQFGSFGSFNGGFTFAEGIAFDTLGDVYVVDEGGFRVEEFAILTAPGSPTSVTAATSSPNQATVTFTAPGSNGGSSILYYLASSTPGNFTATSTGSPIVVTGLSNGTPYTFAVYAVNAVGTSTPSLASNSVIPTPPIVPPTLSTSAATLVNTSSFTLNANISATGGASITQSGFAYGTVSDLSSGAATTTLGGQGGTGNFNEGITGLLASTTYYFRAYAVNSAGTSTGSIFSTTTLSTPVVSAPVVAAPVVYASVGGGSVSTAQLANLLAPSAAATIYLNTLNNRQVVVQSSEVPSQIIPVQSGTSGSSVLVLQNFLVHEGYITASNVTGFFGPITKSAVVSFQLDHGIITSSTSSGAGVVGPKTTQMMNSINTVTTSIPTFSPFNRSLTIGSTGTDVKALQVFLNTHGYSVASSGPGSLGQETSMFGSATAAALKQFQKANGISPAQGYFGAITIAVVNGLEK